MTRSVFEFEKTQALNEFQNALNNGKLDAKVLPILEIINKHPDFYSTSSCSGRIMLLALAHPGAKTDSMVLGKWHDKIVKTELLENISHWDNLAYLYFFAQSPIFHITTNKLGSAVHLRQLGDAAGFKYSSIRSIKPDRSAKTNVEEINGELFSNHRITVELLSTERLNLPLGQNGKVYVDEAYLEIIIDIANRSIAEGDEKLKRLETTLEEGLKLE